MASKGIVSQEAHIECDTHTGVRRGCGRWLVGERHLMRRAVCEEFGQIGTRRRARTKSSHKVVDALVHVVNVEPIAGRRERDLIARQRRCGVDLCGQRERRRRLHRRHSCDRLNAVRRTRLVTSRHRRLNFMLHRHDRWHVRCNAPDLNRDLCGGHPVHTEGDFFGENRAIGHTGTAALGMIVCPVSRRDQRAAHDETDDERTRNDAPVSTRVSKHVSAVIHA